jgi:hypothetical protein
MADARRGLFHLVVVWRLDVRFARSVKQIVMAFEGPPPVAQPISFLLRSAKFRGPRLPSP